MPNAPSLFRNLFRFKTGEKPREQDLNDNLVDKIDNDLNQAITGVQSNATSIAALSTRMDVHADASGNLIAAPPEFAASAAVPTPVFIASNQFYVFGNYTNIFTVNRAIKAILSASQPVSAVKVVAFSGATNRTTITLWDTILDATLSQIQVGFVQYSLPRIDLTALAFDPATQAELDAHKASSDHDARYLSKIATGIQLMVGDLRVQHTQGGTFPHVSAEDLSQAINLFRLLVMGVTSPNTGAIIMYRPQDGAQRTFVTFDSATPLIILGAPLHAGNNKVTNVAAPTLATDAARKAEVDARVAKSGDTMSGPLFLQTNSPIIAFLSQDGLQWQFQGNGPTGSMIWYVNTGTPSVPVWTQVYSLKGTGVPTAPTDLVTKAYADATYVHA